MTRTMWIEEGTVGRNHIAMAFGVDDLRFSTMYWYEDVDFHVLAERYGAALLSSVVFHAVAFEANKLTSLRPDVVDFGPYRDMVSAPFWELWTTVWQNVWGQWRFENDLPDYHGPALAHDLAPAADLAVSIDGLHAAPLAFVGGGKDSLIAMSLLDEAGYDYDTYGYSHSVYGTAAFQHELLDRLTRHGVRAKQHRRHWVFDDFLDSPVVSLRSDLGVRTLTAAETPSSLFGAIPVVLTHGYGTLVLAHERSADHGNLTWEATGESINHQWGKSIEAERLLQSYVRAQLVGNLTYTSVLKPIYDPVIFAALRHRGLAVRDTHSCNVRKPWCEECSKCAYVWINYQAFVDDEVLAGMFRTNLADTPVNQLWFRQMLGLEEHTPFECVGQVPEAMLAFELASARGLHGDAVNTYRERCGPLSPQAVGDLFAVAGDHHTMTPEMAARLVPVLERWAAEGRAYTEGLLDR